MLIPLPESCLVLLIGPSGAGKSTFARRHFCATEILSSDFCRALVCDDENDQTATNDAFELLHLILAKRLSRRRITVIDATNVQPASRASLVEAAQQRFVPVVAILFLLPEEVCQKHNQQRSQRQVPAEVIHNQWATLAETAGAWESEGFEAIYRIESETAANGVSVRRA